MLLWSNWMVVVLKLRPAFKRIRTFQWFVIILAAMTLRKDFAGVTSFIRSMGIIPFFYSSMIHFFHSHALNLPLLTQLWASFALEIFPQPFLINGKRVLVGDGIKIGKEGKKMPAVKSLHQSSQNNTKAKYIRGHSFQAISLLVVAGVRAIAVPLTCRIHEGIRIGGNDRKTLMDKFILLLLELTLPVKEAYLLADAYYCAGAFARTLFEQGIYLITRVRKNAVAYAPSPKHSSKGRPKKYGKKLKLWDSFSDLNQTMIITLYGQEQTIKYRVLDLFWKPYGEIVRFCLVHLPGRGRIILMSVDANLSAKAIITAYAFRFKIECAFKGLIHTIGAFYYHFWMKRMKKTKRRDGDRFIHREKKKNKAKIFQKLSAYNLHVQIGLIAQGLLQYLSVVYEKDVWSNFGSWLRTIRPGVPASEKVVRESLRNQFGYFRHVLPKDPKWQKYVKTIWKRDPPNEKNASQAS